MKCQYCKNPAEMKGYRERDGQVGSEIVCYSCASKTNEELKQIKL